MDVLPTCSNVTPRSSRRHGDSHIQSIRVHTACTVCLRAVRASYCRPLLWLLWCFGEHSMGDFFGFIAILRSVLDRSLVVTTISASWRGIDKVHAMTGEVQK